MSNELQEKLEKFFHQYPRIELSTKKTIIMPREEIRYIYYLEKGNVKQYAGTLKGEDIIFHMFSPQSYFPVMLLLSNMPNQYYFESMRDTILYKAPAKAVVDFIKSDNDVCFDLVTRLSTGLSKSFIKLESILYHDAYYKVLSVLEYLATKLGKSDEGLTLIDIPLTHYDIASWTGLQRETATRQLEKLIKNDFIRYKNHYISFDLQKLIAEKERYKHFIAMQ
jgi:CRP-like cAMP-binding protein